jgi:endonuclease/exonuclease/phosphatase family metal-dependent hydrolase
LIDTCRLSAKDKWDKIKVIKTDEGKIIQNWPENTYFAQGNGFLINKSLSHFPVLDLTANPKKPAYKKNDDKKNFIEIVNFESGLYFGNRDTERRAALVTHFIFNPDPEKPEKPLDIFVINTHLTTLTMEREGIPLIDLEAIEKYRLPQLDIIFKGIISRYNEWKQKKFPDRGKTRNLNRPIETDERYEPVWIIAGDFNFTPDSREYQYIKQMNFMDVMNDKESVMEFTKAGSLDEDPSLTVDYIFAGPKFMSLDEYITRENSKTMVYDYNSCGVGGVSDHFPMRAEISIEPKERKK